MNKKSATKLTKEERHNSYLLWLGLLANNKWKIIVTVILFFTFSFIYTLIAIPVYQARASVQIEQHSQEDIQSPQIDAEVALMTSRTVIGEVVDELHLGIIAKPHFFPGFGHLFYRYYQPDSDMDIAPAKLNLANYAWGGEKIDVDILDVPQAFLQQRLILRAEAEQKFILNTENGRKILDGSVGKSVSSTNGAFRIRVTQLLARPGTEFILVKQRRLTTIQQIQQKLAATVKEDNSGIIDITYEDNDPKQINNVLNLLVKTYIHKKISNIAKETKNTLEFLQQELPERKKSLDQSEQTLADYKVKTGSFDLAKEKSELIEQVANIKTKQRELALKKVDIERLYQPAHPVYQSLLAQQAALDTEQQALAQRIKKLPEIEKKLGDLTRHVDTDRALYVGLIEQIQQLNMAQASLTGDIHIIDGAVTDVAHPTSPATTQVVVISSVIGGLLALGFIGFRAMLNRGCEDSDELESMGLTIQASIPLSKHQHRLEQGPKRSNGNGNKAMQLLALTHPAERSVEALRNLRTNLHFLMSEASDNLMMITGVNQGVGRSFITANLAVLMAQSGQHVLVIDADLHKGDMHSRFKVKESYGLSDVLCSRIHQQQAVQQTTIDNLSVISRGRIPPNPSELLLHYNFSELLKGVSKTFNVVLIVTPPILAVRDAVTVAKQSGTSVMITRFGQDSTKDIEQARRRFAGSGINIKNCVFNGVV